VPVLARLFESAGMSTIIVTNMPYWSDMIGVPRTLGVEMPFGHILGKPGDVEGQRTFILEALDLLEQATHPGMVIHSTTGWAGTEEEAARASHPEVPPPIVGQMGKHIGRFLRNLRRSEA
jgi:hypothetical protein